MPRGVLTCRLTLYDFAGSHPSCPPAAGQSGATADIGAKNRGDHPQPLEASARALYDPAAQDGTRVPPPTLHTAQSVGNCVWKYVAAYVRARLHPR